MTNVVFDAARGRWMIDGYPIYVEGPNASHPEQMAYVDPCGAAPDGLYFPVSAVERLARVGAIVINWRDNPDDLVDGFGFQIVGESESEEEDRNCALVVAASRTKR